MHCTLERDQSVIFETASGIQAAPFSQSLTCNVDAQQAAGAIDFHVVDNSAWGAGQQIKARVANQVAYWSVSLSEAKGESSLVWLNTTDIQSVLDEVPTLKSLVDEAYNHLSKLFPNEEITLRASRDPEEASPDVLVIKVTTNKEFDEADSLWQSFTNDWWLPNYDRGGDRLTILLDF